MSEAKTPPASDMEVSLSKFPLADTPRDASPSAPETTLEDAARAFKPTTAFYLAMTTLALLTFIVSIDATALAVALPVSPHLAVEVMPVKN